MINLVLWFFILALAPVALNLAWKLLSGAGLWLHMDPATRHHGG